MPCFCSDPLGTGITGKLVLIPKFQCVGSDLRDSDLIGLGGGPDGTTKINQPTNQPSSSCW